MLTKPKQISLFDFDEPETGLSEKGRPAKKKAATPDQRVDSASQPPVEIPETVTTPSLAENKVKPNTSHTPKESAEPRERKSTRGRKSIRELSAEVHRVQVPPDEVLFQKSYYAIGKVAEMFKVNQSLLRLWENEFDILKPKKNGKGDRYFRPEDIKNIQLIHHLTRERKYTMEGAKEYFRNNKKADEKFALIESLKKIKSFLLELKANL
jgi:DNA-binding transcriptional MerR regulator